MAEISQVIHALCTAPPSKQKLAIETYFTPTASFTHPFCRTGSFANSRWFILQIYRWYKILSPHVDFVVESVCMDTSICTALRSIADIAAAFDEKNLLLYVAIHQVFKILLIPFYKADVRFLTVLQLTTDWYPHEHKAPEPPSLSNSEKDAQTYATVAAADLAYAEHSSPVGAVERSGPSNGQAASRKEKKYFIQAQEDLYQTNEWIKFVVPWGVGTTLITAWQFFSTFQCATLAALFWLVTWLYEHVLDGNRRKAQKKWLNKD